VRAVAIGVGVAELLMVLVGLTTRRGLRLDAPSGT
jgi:hypothetical protein